MDKITENKNYFTATAVSLSIHAAVAIMLLAAASNPFPRLLGGGDEGYIMVSLVAGETAAKEAGPVLPASQQRRAVPPEEEIRVTPAAGKSVSVSKRDSPPVRLAMLGNSGRETDLHPAAVSYKAASRGGMELPVRALSGGAGGASSGGGKISLAVPKYRENAHPRYPMLARSRGEEGVVLLSAEVLSNGKVGGLRIKKTSGYRLLDQSALEAVKHWQFEPARRMGITITVWVDIPVRFALRDSDG